MLPDGTELENSCIGDAKYEDPKLRVAAIVNWYGISEVNDLRGRNLKSYAPMWMGSQRDAQEIAQRVSPITCVRVCLLCLPFTETPIAWCRTGNQFGCTKRSRPQMFPASSLRSRAPDTGSSAMLNWKMHTRRSLRS